MAINRRDFLKATLAGSAAMIGNKINGMNQNGPNPSESGFYDGKYPPAKGKSVLGLRCKPIPAVRIGVVGLGRGGDAVNRNSGIM